MKDYQYKVVLVFFIIGLIIILGMGIILSLLPNAPYNFIILVTSITLIIYSIGGIIVAVITKKKIIDPMSRMLKSSYSYSDDELEGLELDEDSLSNLRERLRKLNEQKIETDTILEHMTDGVISFDLEGNVSYINLAARKMLEIYPGEITFKQIFSNEKEAFKDLEINLEKIIYLDNLASSEIRIHNKQGFMDLHFVVIKDEAGRATGLLVVIQDITQHVELDNMRKDFVADVSHELRTPLQSIMGFSETLLEDDVDEETSKHFLQEVYDNSQRMKNLVNDLLTLSRYDDPKNNKANAIDFDLGELTKKCKENFDVECKKKKIDCQCLVTMDVPPVHADKSGIERVIINIISNAVKYTPDGGKIDIYVGYVHNDAYIKVKDTGIGIPKDSINKVFERFYRVDKARSRKIGGTGLGLPIAKKIVEQNNGSITIQSELNKGTEVTIRIPVKKEDKNK